MNNQIRQQSVDADIQIHTSFLSCCYYYWSPSWITMETELASIEFQS